MSTEELTDLLTEWQKRLRLQDWDMTCEIVPVSDMSGCWHKGNCAYYLNKRHAKIKIIDEAHYSGMTPYDAEIILVHELLHCHFAPFAADDDTPADTAQEQAIHAISCALVATKREGLHSEPPDTV